MPRTSGPTGPSVSTVKRLFALSGNRCAFPRCSAPIVQDGVPVGQVCHIKGHRPSAPRYDPTQTPEERHAFENLVLLCSPHHTLVDAKPTPYSVAQLQEMKKSHEARATPLPDDQAQEGARVLIDQGVSSIGQTGGITARTVNITYNEASPTAPELLRSAIHKPASAKSLEAPTFFEGGSYLIDHGASVDEEGRSSSHIYWHYGPSAWLRFIPSGSKTYGRTELTRIVGAALPPLIPFGLSSRTEIFTNTQGTTLVGYDGPLPNAIATRITQVTRDGEIWGLNRVFVDEVRRDGIRSNRILWSPLKQDFEQTISSYLDFCQRSLKFERPFIIVAGLACVDNAEFIRDKAKWFVDPPKTARCLDSFVSRACEVTDIPADPSILLEPFYTALFDSCALSFADEPRVYTYPR